MEDVIEDLHGHVHRVSDLAVDLGSGIGLGDDDLDRLALVGVLHDVGKVHIDPAILGQAGTPRRDSSVITCAATPNSASP